MTHPLASCPLDCAKDLLANLAASGITAALPAATRATIRSSHGDAPP